MPCRKTENEVFETMAGNLEIVQGCGLPIELSYNQVYYFSMHDVRNNTSTYFQIQVFVSPWLSDPADEARHARLFDRIKVWGREENPEKIRDAAMIVMLYLICILNPTGCKDLK